ncbi:MAG: chorismate mutase [Chlorobiales bacterium]|jgi:chorismate mutase|nr:chorismate mutase [Chlorobiales bacterium]
MLEHPDRPLTLQEELEWWRKQVDRIDAELALLLGKRTRCAQEIIRIKQQTGQQILQRDREKEVIQHVLSQPHEPLPSHSLERIYMCIMEETRNFQHHRVSSEGNTAASSSSQAKS